METINNNESGLSVRTKINNNFVEVSEHISNVENPHGVTAEQLGLSDIGGDITALEDALTAHTIDTDNPHTTTATQVGLGNVDNTSDINKPVSTLQQQAINQRALASDLTAHIADIVKHLSTAQINAILLLANARSNIQSQIDNISNQFNNTHTVDYRSELATILDAEQDDVAYVRFDENHGNLLTFNIYLSGAWVFLAVLQPVIRNFLTDPIDLETESNFNDFGLVESVADLESAFEDFTLANNVIDVVGTFSALTVYPTAKLKVNDIIIVSADETHLGAKSFYKWMPNWVWSFSETVKASKASVDNHIGNLDPTAIHPREEILGETKSYFLPDNSRIVKDTELFTHVNNKTNPHEVTAAQVGALTVAGDKPNIVFNNVLADNLRTMRDVVRFTATPMATGTLQLKLPSGINPSVLNIEMTIAKRGPMLEFAKVYLQVNTTNWTTTGYDLTVVGVDDATSPIANIRFAKSSDLKFVILFGVITTVWDYLVLTVDRVTLPVGGIAVDIPRDGWTVSILATESGLTDIVQAVPKVMANVDSVSGKLPQLHSDVSSIVRVLNAGFHRISLPASFMLKIDVPLINDCGANIKIEIQQLTALGRGNNGTINMSFAYTKSTNLLNYADCSIDNGDLLSIFKSVRLGVDGNSKPCVLLGIATTAWRYGSIVVSSANVYPSTGVSASFEKWAISQITSDATITNIVPLTVRTTPSLVQAPDEATAITNSTANPNNIYFWEEV